MSGACDPGTTGDETDTAACDRDTSGVVCGTLACTNWDVCLYDCATGVGTRRRTCTDRICADGVCAYGTPFEQTDTTACTDPVAGARCTADSVCVPTGACSYGGTCAETGDIDTLCSYLTCQAGACFSPAVHTVVDHLLCARDTDGNYCDHVHCGGGDWRDAYCAAGACADPCP